MKTGVIDQNLQQMPKVRLSGDRVAMAIASLLVGGVIMLSTLSLGLHEANLIQRIALLSTGGTVLGVGIFIALSTAFKKKRPAEVVPEINKEDLPDVFARDLAGSLHLYLIRNRRFGKYQQFRGKLEDQEGFLAWFGETLQKMGLDRKQVLKVMKEANQSAASIYVNGPLYQTTQEVGAGYEMAEPFLPQGEKTGQVYLIDVTKKGPRVRAVYRYTLMESNKHVRSEVIFYADGSDPRVVIGKPTTKPNKSNTRVR